MQPPWISRAESAADVSRARRTLLEGLEVIRSLPSSVREHLLEEARGVAAAVSPELLAEIPITRHGGRARFASINIVQIMLAHGHVDAAFDYLLRDDDEASFPFPSVGGVLQRLDPHSPECAARRMMLLRHAVEVWHRSTSGRDHLERDHFVRLFGHFWKEFPSEEALAVARMIVAQAAEEPDTGTSAGYANEIHFTSPRQNTLFQILHVLRHLDPALAQSLIGSHDQLAAGVRRYPNGLETVNEEAETEAKRRKADGATCGAVTYSRAIPEILTASADSLTLLEAGTLSGRSKTQSRSIGKTRQPPPATTHLRNTGHPQAHSARSFIRPGGAWGLRPPSY